MKIILITLITLLLTACSNTKSINGINQTFVEYVVFNSNSEWSGPFIESEAECFPVNRYIKWKDTK